jgi:GTPase-associated protein 1, N-terminal domain type 2/GTPase-associated protein 1, middle domain
VSQELFYTSAPHGLKPGSRGFCTVATTSGMPKNLADRLESLSAYRHIFPPNDLNADRNPIVFSHLRVLVGGTPYHVLSRIGAAGLDYSQRSNKIAHHVVLEDQELVSAGPAALLASTGFMEVSWTGDPQIIPVGRSCPQITSSPVVCREWKKLTGDAGWGGRLAESALGNSKRSVALIFQPGMDILPLIAESLALLPAPLRWQVTFSTFYTKLPPDIECQWRFVLAGSPEAKTLATSRQTELIDLTQTTAIAPDSPFTEAARTGIAPEQLRDTESQPSIAPKEVAHSPFGKGHTSNDDPELELESFHPVPTPNQQSAPSPPMPLGARRFQRVARPKRRLWPILTCVCVIVSAIPLFGLLAIKGLPQFTIHLGQQSNEPGNSPHQTGRSEATPESAASASHGADGASHTDEAANKSTSSSPSAVVADASKQSASSAGSPPEDTSTKNDGNTQKQNNSHEDSKTVDTAKQSQSGTKPESHANPSSGPSVIETMEFASLGPLAVGSSLPGGDKVDAMQLSAMPKGDAPPELLGGSEVLKWDQWTIEIVPDSSAPINSRFLIQLRPLNAKPGPFGGDKKIALLSWNDGLQFQWSKDAMTTDFKNRADQLRNCVLQITGSASKTLIALRVPVVVKTPLIVEWGKPKTTIPLDIEAWPHSSPQLELNNRAQDYGYATKHVSPTEITLQHRSNSSMPSFRLVIDSATKSLVLSYTCTVKEIEEHDQPWLQKYADQRLPDIQRDLQNKLSDLRKDFDEKVKRLSKAKGEQSATADNPEIVNMKNEMDALQSQIENNNHKSDVIRQCLQIAGRTIAFEVAMTVGNNRVTLAKSAPDVPAGT